jgi:hypothetical protein
MSRFENCLRDERSREQALELNLLTKCLKEGNDVNHAKCKHKQEDRARKKRRKETYIGLNGSKVCSDFMRINMRADTGNETSRNLSKILLLRLNNLWRNEVVHSSGDDKECLVLLLSFL